MKRKPRSTSAGRASYTVGNCKPPVEHRFKPNQSGNPKGRPKGSKNLKSIVRAASRRKVAVGQGTRRRNMLISEVGLHHLQQQVLKGDRKAILDYLEILERYEDREDLNFSDHDLSAEDNEIVEAFLARELPKLQTKAKSHE